MGYYTNYKISVLEDACIEINQATCEHNFSKDCSYCPECGKPRLQLTLLEEIVENFIRSKRPSWGNFSPFADACKWYEHDNDMREFSKSYPNIIFVLHGEGEESGDIWYKYFKNGKMQEAKAKLVYDKYDEKKLQ